MDTQADSDASSLLAPRPSFGRVAVIHDWLTGMRGGEEVLEGILDIVPEAEIFTLFHFPESVSKAIESRTIRTSRLQNVARRAHDYRELLPLFPGAVRRWDLSGFDLIVSSSHCVAKGVSALGKPHVCYCHTPMRYVWDRFDDYFPRTKPFVRAAMSLIAPRLRRWDVDTAEGVTRFVANSNFVRGRIEQYYLREAEVIHPFVAEEFLAAPLREEREDFDLIVSALVPYKRIDLAMATGRRLIVIGNGPAGKALQAAAGPNVTFLGSVSRAVIVDHLSRARAVILPGVEDFGIVPLEAMALGTPVVAFRAGGALDSVVEGTTGIFFDEPAVDSLRQALEKVDGRGWDRAAIRAHAAAFSRARFTHQLQETLRQVTA